MSRVTHGGNSRRLVATIGIVGAIGALGAAGTYSAFTASTATTQNISSGTLSLTAGANSLSVAASDIAPGDTIQRAITITPSGTVDAAGIKLTTAASPAPSATEPLAFAGNANSMTMTVEKCAAAPVQSGATWSCTSPTTLLNAVPVLQTDAALSGLSVTAGTPNYLRVTLALPSAAGNEFQGKATTITYTFTSDQRTGTAK